MDTSSQIILSSLGIANLILVLSSIRNYTHIEEERDRLLRSRGVDLASMTKGEKKTALKKVEEEIEPLQSHAWIVGCVVCFDILIVGAIISHWWAENFFVERSGSVGQKSLFGDSFGAVNALVSAFAFAGMIVSFFMQRSELRLQRKELQENRQEMSQQTAQFTAENRNLEIQRFENFFYNMLNLHQTIVNDLRFDYTDNEVEDVPTSYGGTISNIKQLKEAVIGRAVFRDLYLGIRLNRGSIQGIKKSIEVDGLLAHKTQLSLSYFDHYFNHLFKIIQFVDSKVTSNNFSSNKSKFLSFEEAYEYISYLRGTLSRYELVWLFYNDLLSKDNRSKLLIEKYSLLESLRPELLALSKENRQFLVNEGFSYKLFEEAKLPFSDYYFYMTTEKTAEKYHITAFWDKDHLDEGKRQLKDWESFIQAHSKKSAKE